VAAACSRRRGGYRGYAFIANEEGQGIAAIDLETMAVARRIPLDGSPTQVLASGTRPVIYALTPDTGSVHEVQVYKLSSERKSAVAATAVSMALAADEKSMYLLARQPRALISVSTETLQAQSSIALPDDPTDFAVTVSGNFAAVTTPRGVWVADLTARSLRGPLAEGEFGAVQFRSDGKVVIAADLGQRRLSLFDTATGKLITHLPMAVRPDNLCIDQTGGQLFVTGDGMDAVVIVQPYQTEVAGTVLAGRTPGPMAVSSSMLFVASPQSGNVSILDINSKKVIGVAQVGADPGFVTVTPDNQYALVLNRKSGDVTVLRLSLSPSALVRERNMWAVLTVIPVGSKPVSGAVAVRGA
jgi:DNA-binding beta-propeller fold protein YncE